MATGGHYWHMPRHTAMPSNRSFLLINACQHHTAACLLDTRTPRTTRPHHPYCWDGTPWRASGIGAFPAQRSIATLRARCLVTLPATSPANGALRAFPLFTPHSSDFPRYYCTALPLTLTPFHFSHLRATHLHTYHTAHHCLPLPAPLSPSRRQIHAIVWEAHSFLACQLFLFLHFSSHFLEQRLRAALSLPLLSCLAPLSALHRSPVFRLDVNIRMHASSISLNAPDAAYR